MARARRSIRSFALILAAAACAGFPLAARSAQGPPGWSSWHASRVIRDHGYPVFTVDGKPFFVYGAAFFYERVPRERWRSALAAYKRIGINTIDLYVIWNWHEPVEGPPDFTGTTDPRRNLIALMQIVDELGLRVVLRPGPVVRNEWRNGGYPDWLLARPDYDMPAHDILEGRYPATATLQNARADAAGAQWLANVSHRHYASLWLSDVLRAVAPYARDVIAIALDDDQGAYLDNDTWPAPHWHAYIDWLHRVVASVVGSSVPLFVNTFEMKVPAASPAWAWGNWYQSNAYAIGAHDLAELDFATGLLATQVNRPLMQAEFQAGWLQLADDGVPRPADPANTALALHELLRDGIHGIVNFPVQDTIYPDGWEVPWANWSYAWDAALTVDLHASPRYAPTAAFGADIARYGSLLARSHPALDGSILWPPSLFEPSGLSNADFAAFAGATIAAQEQCRARELTCGLVDLAQPLVDRSPKVVMPIVMTPRLRALLLPHMQRELLALQRAHRLVADPSAIAALHGMRAPDATRLVADDGSFTFFDVVNPSQATRATPLGKIPPRSARLFLLGSQPQHAPVLSAPPPASPPPFSDRDGLQLHNARVRLTLAPNAGARIAELAGTDDRNAASSVGLLRDAVDPEPTPSSRDYIAAYTHPLPAGTFNRPYACRHVNDSQGEKLLCTYDAPDVPAGGARFERTVSLGNTSNDVVVDLRMIPHDPSSTAHLENVSGFSFDDGDGLARGTDFVGIIHQGRMTTLRWKADDVARVELRRTRGAELVTLVFAVPEVRLLLQENRPYSARGSGGMADAAASKAAEATHVGSTPTFPTNI
jgi:Glycosyl hydrolases family 35